MASRRAGPPPTPRREMKRPLPAGPRVGAVGPAAPTQYPLPPPPVYKLARLYPLSADTGDGKDSTYNIDMIDKLLRTFDPSSRPLIGQGDSGSKVYSLDYGVGGGGYGGASDAAAAERIQLAIKVARQNEAARKELKAWSAIDSRCRARHTLPLLGAWQVMPPSGGQSLYFAAPRCEESLSTVIKRAATPTGTGRASEADVKKLMAVLPDIVDALSCLKDAGYYHRDLKPDNIYYCDGKWNLGDFGVAISADEYKQLTPDDIENWNAGTGAYQPKWDLSGIAGDIGDMTDEELAAIDFENLRPVGFNYSSDVYALGVTMKQLFPVIERYLTPDGRVAVDRLISRMTAARPEDRPTLEQLAMFIPK